ncbi:hypothetical protein ACFSRY_17405 [Pontibacter locisalis]|uniref:O-antigen polysaccharide polymerase Wzy n=1 Tax=Pontibacter locisalis TaxID=1719035 RepID=A0ABW5IQJ5_9BACT
MDVIEVNSREPNKAVFQLYSLLFLAIILFAFSSLSYLAILGVLFSLYILNELIYGFGKGFPVNLVISFLACLQWIIGPVLSYYTGINHPFYGMQVPEDYYFSFIIPGVILYHFGLSLPVLGVKQIPKLVIESMREDALAKVKGAYYLIGLGFVAGFAAAFSPPSLIFFLYLLSQVKFIGCFYLYVSNSASNKVLYLVFATLVLNALASAMFHDLLLWSLFFLFVFSIKHHISLKTKFLGLFAGLFLLLLLQSVKYQYRNIAWSNASLGTFAQSEVFFGMVFNKLMSPNELFDAKANETSITRLNQGWIISRVMNYIPYVEQFADGETVEGAFSAALLPRFLSENKAMAGGRAMMERFTGIILQEGTSMNISLIGEGYGNYGRDGGIIFMFLIGIVFSLILRQLFIKSQENPTILFWIPFLFLQVVKAETDLTTTLNYLVKASIVMILVFYGFRKFLKIEL